MESGTATLGMIVAVSNDNGLVVRTGIDLIVGGDGERLLRVLQISLGLIGVRGRQTAAQIFETKSVRGQGRRISLDADRRLLSAADGDKSHPRKLRDFLS